MPSITKKIFIRAEQEKVYDVINDVEAFAGFSDHIKEIRLVAPGRYAWRVEFFGKTVTWNADTKKSRPDYYSWHTTRGLQNSGSFRLKPHEGGTWVVFTMEFRIPFTLLDRITSPIISRLMESLSEDLILKVKKKLEE